MRGRKAKERDRYVVRTEDGTLVEVSREVYLEWYQSKRRERYQQEKFRKYGVCSLNELEKKGDYSRVMIRVQDNPEEAVLRNICIEEVRKALSKLSESDAELIVLLYFKEVTVTEAARINGCCRKTIRNRHKRILEELYQIIKESANKKSIENRIEC